MTPIATSHTLDVERRARDWGAVTSELTGFAAPSGEITRRSLLLAGAGVAAAAAIPNAAVAAGKKVARPSHLDRSTWEPLVGTILETRNRGLARVPLVLARIDDAAVSYGNTEKFRRRSFTLVFRGPSGQPLLPGTHKLFVPRVGKVDVWLSSADLGDDGWTYTAVFANARVRQRPPKKPRLSGSKEQRTERAKRRRRKRLRRLTAGKAP